VANMVCISWMMGIVSYFIAGVLYCCLHQQAFHNLLVVTIDHDVVVFWVDQWYGRQVSFKEAHRHVHSIFFC